MDDLKSAAGEPMPYSEPDARNDRAWTREGKPVTIDLLENDEGATGIWEINGRRVDFGDTVRLDSGARVTVGEDGRVVYVPSASKAFGALDSGEFGFDSFRYTAFDNEFGSDTATVRVRITGVNDAPVAHDDFLPVPMPLPEPVLYQKPMPFVDESASTWTGCDDPIFTTLAIGEEGDPDPLPSTKMVGEEGDPDPLPDIVTTLAIGEEGDPDPLPSTKMVGEEGDPDPLPDTITTLAIGEEGDPDPLQRKVTISPLANDRDADGDDLTIAEINGTAVSAGDSVELESGAVLTVSKDGDTLIYRGPIQRSNDADSRIAFTDGFTYRASDGDALSNPAQVWLWQSPFYCYDELV